MFIETLLMVSVLGSVVCECPDGFYRHDDSCYSLSRVQGTWAQASVYCHSVSAELVTVDSQSEGLFVRGLLQNHGSGYHPNDFWLGATDILKEGEWTWTKSGKLVNASYTDWASGKPDHGSHNDEHCMCVRGDSSYHWDDDNCEDMKHFVCEKGYYTS